MNTREVVTLQVGSFANYVGAHYWNLQDELIGHVEEGEWKDAVGCINHDILYAWGEDYRGNLVYRPRLIAVDFTGSLGGYSFTNRGTLQHYDTVATWGGGVEVHQMREPVAKSSFINELEQQETDFYTRGAADEAAAAEQARALEEAAAQLNSQDGVRFWTDYCKATLHPRSVHQLPGLNADMGFSGYADNVGTTGRPDVREELQELVRVFTEQCDRLQGFQCLVDHLSGFGKVAEDIVTHIRDEFSSKTVVLFALERPADIPEMGIPRFRHILNQGLSLSRLAAHTSLMVPLGTSSPLCDFPHLTWQPQRWFHSSAILAAALDGFTTPWRVNGSSPSPLGTARGSVDLASWCSLLSGEGAPLAAGRLSFPAASLPADLQQLGTAADQRAGTGPPQVANQVEAHAPSLRGLGHASLTAGIADNSWAECRAECITLRGARRGGNVSTSDYAASALDAVLLQDHPRCVLHRCITPTPLLVPLPFPHFFNSGISRCGEISYRSPISRTEAQHNGAGFEGTSSSREMNGDAVGLVNGGPTASSSWGGHVASLPMLAKLTATVEFKTVLQSLEQRFRQVQRSAAGQAIVAGWEMGRSDTEEACVSLLGLASLYGDDELEDTDGDDD